MSDSAFPTMGLILRDPGFPDQVMKGEIGLTKRELFAALVMQGLSANSSDQINAWGAEQTAKCSVSFADALLAELEKPHA